MHKPCQVEALKNIGESCDAGGPSLRRFEAYFAGVAASAAAGAILP